MALDIALDAHNTGVVARYWKITSAQFDHLRDSVTVWLHGWTDAQARSTGRTPAASVVATLDKAELPHQNLHGANTASLYEALKTKAEAAAHGAEDGFEHAEHAIGAGIKHLAGALDC